MKLADYPEKFIDELTIDQIHKLFPDNFYTKYAPHLRLLQYQKKLIRHNSEPPKVKFKKHQLPQQSKVLKKNKISQFDRVDDLIKKNYEQFHRMSQYSKELGYKLQVGPSKSKDAIKTTRQDFIQPNPQTFEKVKLLQDLAYERKVQQLKKKKIISQQVVKFKKTQRTMKSHKNIPKTYSTLKLTKSQYFQSPIQSQRYTHASQQVLKLLDKTKKFNQQLKQMPKEKKHLSMIMHFNHSLKQLNKFQKIYGPKLNTRINQVPKNMQNASMLLTMRVIAQKKSKDLLYQTELVKKKSASLNIQKIKRKQKYRQDLKKLLHQVQQK